MIHFLPHANSYTVDFGAWYYGTYGWISGTLQVDYAFCNAGSKQSWRIPVGTLEHVSESDQ